jgi:hypothetical protein
MIRSAVLTCSLSCGVLLLIIVGCQSPRAPSEATPRPIDAEATDRTRALFQNLRSLDNQILFGHQDDLAYGVHWDRRTDSLARASGVRRSDVRAVTGSYPAVYGWDVGDIGSSDTVVVNLDSVPFEAMKTWMVEGYERGGVITVSWHMDNPVTGGSSWDTTSAVSKLLPDSSHHEEFVAMLDRFARFADDLETGFWKRLGLGHHVPIIFRPFHEMNGDWFWWGSASPEDYRALWRFTVEYLREEKNLHHLLYAYSPDIFQGRHGYLRYYPGDEYVDVLGYDDYHTLPATFADTIRVDTLTVDTLSLSATDTTVLPEPGTDWTILTDTVTLKTSASVGATHDSGRASPAGTNAMSPDSAVTRAIRRVIVDSVRIAEDTIKAQGARALADQFRNVVQLAKERGKVAAFTETGVEGIPDSTWWTDRLLPTLKTDSTTRKLAYVLVWRNANERRKPGHHFAPYPGHASADDFVRFYMDPFTSFEEDLPDLYE